MFGPGRPVFVLFGSSIVQFSFSNQGWGAILAHTFARKIGRHNTERVCRMELKACSRGSTSSFPTGWCYSTFIVIVYFGGNDSIEPHPSGLGPHVPLPEFIDNMKKIALHLKGLSEKIRVMFLSTPPVNEEQIRIKCVDLWTAFRKRDDWMTTCFTDGIHFSSEGSELVAKEILKAMEEAGWEPSLCCNSMPTEFDQDLVYDLVTQDGESINVSDLQNHS
ncbi:vacuolar cation/proton exchanger 3-like [Hibiscus syriacus]|uniref:Vacuolar cation/proton exchanger 3-like n=1 Tax=Hibiscus syriacus TaxID=106335 RepID=A0A6A3B8Y6_HIBSY|nr:vacuolar cation/proton exchanger 3-like [Hibiscus syriacus]